MYNSFVFVIIQMNEFINVIKRDPQVRIRIKDLLERYNRSPYYYHSKISYDTLIQNVNLKDVMNLMGTTKVDIDILLIMKISRTKYLEAMFPNVCIVNDIYLHNAI